MGEGKDSEDNPCPLSPPNPGSEPQNPGLRWHQPTDLITLPSKHTSLEVNSGQRHKPYTQKEGPYFRLHPSFLQALPHLRQRVWGPRGCAHPEVTSPLYQALGAETWKLPRQSPAHFQSLSRPPAWPRLLRANETTLAGPRVTERHL